MSASAAVADWEGDDAHNGCKSWLVGWRQTHGDTAPLPSLSVADGVGREAVGLMRDGVPRAEIARLLWAAGRDGQLLDGRLAADIEAEAAARRAVLAEHTTPFRRRR